MEFLKNYSATKITLYLNMQNPDTFIERFVASHQIKFEKTTIPMKS